MIRFSDVRSGVTAQNAARFYGAEFDRRGWAICPFHNDTRPSVSFKNGRFRCWSCGASGDAIDYVSRLFSLGTVDAARKLDADFHLGLSRKNTDSLEAQQKKEEHKAIVAAHSAFEQWRAETLKRLNAVSYVAHTALKRLPAPRLERECFAVQFAARAEYLSDCLEAGTPEDQAQLYQERKEMDAWTVRILNGS